MRKAFGFFGAVVVTTSFLGCAVQTDDGETEQAEAVEQSADPLLKAKTDPLAMPTAIVSFEKQNMWGMHHLEWHTVRQWDRLGSSDLAWAKKQGWARASVQEGEAGNGLAFLAMHRAMIQILTEKFPTNADLFKGWATVPTDPRDAADPLPHNATTAFDKDMLAAIDRLQNHLESFASDDELGLFIETQMRPLKGQPSHRSSDPSSGIHNYVHNRFSDSSSTIDLGDPSVNLQNKRFWRLHGWIDARWTAFRQVTKASDTDPTYVSAIKAARDMMNMGGHMHMMRMGHEADDATPPESLRKVFSRP